MANGSMTAAIARSLREEREPQGFDVLFDHGQTGVDPAANLGKLKSWFGPKYAATTILADLDIAIVERQSDRLVALIEIEETTSKPKVLLGDAFATLLGDHITFQGKRHLSVGPWTTLIVLACIPTPTPANQHRIDFLEQQVNQIKAGLTTPNASIGRVVMGGFQDEVDLGEKLRALIQAAIGAQ